MSCARAWAAGQSMLWFYWLRLGRAVLRARGGRAWSCLARRQRFFASWFRSACASIVACVAQPRRKQQTRCVRPVGEQRVNAGVAKLCKFKSKCKFETTNAFFHGYRVNTDVNAYCKGVYDTYVQSSYPSFASIFLHDFITKAHTEVDQSDFHDRATKANIRRLYWAHVPYWCKGLTSTRCMV